MKNEDLSPRDREPLRELDPAEHERLCAYVFGELQGAERAAFEAELARSPELQAEHARLVATIDLVQRAVPDEGLSTAVRQDIVAAARRSRFRFLRGRTLATVAAVFVALLGGVFALQYFGGEGRGPYRYELFGGKAERVADMREKAAPSSAPEPELKKRELAKAGELTDG